MPGPWRLRRRDRDRREHGRRICVGHEFAVGGAITENVILAGHFGLWFDAPSWRLDPALTTESTTVFTRVQPYAVGIGAELRYYFMPSNVFLSATLLKSTVSRASALAHRNGPGLQVGIGKEWWVGDHWGLGIALEGLAAHAWGDGTQANAFGAALAFTATYN